jgi:hypothetical protein
MMGRLRSTMQTLGAAAALIYALSLAGLSTSHAAPSNLSRTDYVSRQPCNDVCKAYLAWSDRVSAMFHPSQPVAQTAVHHGKPAGWMVHHPASKTRQPSSNSFAQFPVRSDATPQSAETSQAEDAPSRPADPIADRFPAADGFVTARLAGTGSATNDTPESAVVSATDAIPATQGTSKIDDTAGGLDIRFAVPLFLALCALSALVLWGWFRGKALVAAGSAKTAGFGVPGSQIMALLMARPVRFERPPPRFLVGKATPEGVPPSRRALLFRR